MGLQVKIIAARPVMIRNQQIGTGANLKISDSDPPKKNSSSHKKLNQL